MKITGNIEINGIQRVVFYKKNIYERVTSFAGKQYWHDFIRNKSLENEVMCNIVKSATNNPARKVWVHGESINIDRVSKAALSKANNIKNMRKRMFLKELDRLNITRQPLEIHLR